MAYVRISRARLMEKIFPIASGSSARRWNNRGGRGISKQRVVTAGSHGGTGSLDALQFCVLNGRERPRLRPEREVAMRGARPGGILETPPRER
jgi:hypothetical protein